jgi:HAD superfamily hydrolase (TIGR01484 family)
MQPLRRFDEGQARRIAYVLCDLDDTLTLDGRLPAASYAGLEQLSAAGRQIVVVTGRPAGWCDLIARFWPVAGVVGENGAFYFRYDRDANAMRRRFLFSDAHRARDRARLMRFFRRLQKHHPGIRLAADQPFRVSDIAIDICEDVAPLSPDGVRDIVMRLEAMGATVKVSSIHVNAWIGRFDKLSMITRFLREQFGVGPETAKRAAVYVGDSPNDEPMFAFFPWSVGVRNIESFAGEMQSLPRFITRARGGNGFLEIARLLERNPLSSRGRSRRSSSRARR